MNPVSVLPVAMGAVVAFVGFWHLLAYLRGIREREHLYFALTCLGVALYDVGAGVSYAGGDHFVAALGQRLQHVALAVIGPSLLWFALAYTRQELRLVARVATLYGALQGLAVLTIWNDWVLTAARHVTVVRLPWGATVVYDEARHGPLLEIANVFYLFTILLLLFLAARYWRRAVGEDRSRARRLAFGLGVFLVGALNDMAVASSAYEFLYLIEYAYGGLVLVMTYGMSTGLLELARTRSELRQSLARLQRIFDSVEEVYMEATLDGTILEVSPSARRWVGPEIDLRGRQVLDFYADPEDRSRLRAALERHGRVRDFEGTARLPDGRGSALRRQLLSRAGGGRLPASDRRLAVGHHRAQACGRRAPLSGTEDAAGAEAREPGDSRGRLRPRLQQPPHGNPG